jgi:hypothetical protein
MGQPEATGVDKDLATLRGRGCAYHGIRVAGCKACDALAVTLNRVEAELSRLREQRDAERKARKAAEELNADDVVRARTNLGAIAESERARAETAEARLQQALALGDKWLDLNYGYLNPERDPLLVEFAVATREALAGPDTPADSQEDKT